MSLAGRHSSLLGVFQLLHGELNIQACIQSQ